MSDALNPNWYNRNEGRNLPLDDAATGVDDAGNFLPQDIVVDLALALPRGLVAAAAAAIVGVTATRSATSVVIAAGEVPLAAVTVAAPVVPYVAYPLSPLQGGVGGWIVLGAGAAGPYAGRFSTPAQGRLLARCVRAYPPPPVESIAKEGLATVLAGVVTVRGGADIAVGSAVVKIGGAWRRVLTLGLAAAPARDVFTLYAGGCAGRPESGTCPRPAVETLNDVVPDCDGNLDIAFRGVTARPIPGGGGLLVSLPVGMAAACGGPGPADDVFEDRCRSSYGD